MIVVNWVEVWHIESSHKPAEKMLVGAKLISQFVNSCELTFECLKLIFKNVNVVNWFFSTYRNIVCAWLGSGWVPTMDTMRVSVDSLRFRYVHKTYFLKPETFHKIFNFIFNYNPGSLRVWHYTYNYRRFYLTRIN